MEMAYLEKLIDLVARSPLTELEVTDAAGTVRIVKRGLGDVTAATSAPLGRPPFAETMERLPPATSSKTEVLASSAGFVQAPMTGVFYSGPSPGAPPFVTVGAAVEVGQTLALLEAMKTLTKITADRAGIVRRLLVKNGDVVTDEQPLFDIE